jgi:hypothetical protein
VARADEALTAELLSRDAVGTRVVVDSTEKGNTMRGA